jgi:hypothetical protein
MKGSGSDECYSNLNLVLLHPYTHMHAVPFMARNHGQSAVLIVGTETVPTCARDIRATSNLL